MRTLTYSPSINIIRDLGKELNYVVTPNANRIFSKISSNYRKGSRSFNIVGSYGTGKSAFVLAFEQTLLNRSNHFNTKFQLNNKDNVELVNVIGENKSISSTFAHIFGIEKENYSTSDIVKAIDRFYKKNEQKALVIVIDEFGKFLEYAAKNNPEKELYFIQQLAEFVNDTSKEILLFTVLHKNFNAYSLELSKSQIDDWNKVKGRLVELNFNEPVEQLLFLASEKIEALNQEKANRDKIKIVHKTIMDSKLFPLRDYNTIPFSEKIFPFELLSASVLTLALQEYAQNERSLFSFLENDDELGIINFNKKSNPFYNLANVYDYLIFNFFSFLSTKYNPHLNQWNAIKHSLERAEMQLSQNIEDAFKLIKTIGLLNIFAHKGGKINADFIDNYGKHSLGIDNPSKIVDELVKYKILHFTKYDNRFKILQGTDLDFELAITEAGNFVERIKDVTLYLKKYFDFPVIIAKRVSYEKGTPRLFRFILSETPVCLKPANETDGYINLIFSKDLKISQLRDYSLECSQAILYGLFTKTDKIEDTLYEIEKINKVIERNADDKVAVYELKTILEHYKSLLNYYVLESIYSGSDQVKWYFNGSERKISSQKGLNSVLSDICDTVYFLTPVFRNEMVNKTKISGTISFARKKLFSKVLNEQSKPDFGLDEAKFPPEKTIFLSLIKSTGIYNYNNGHNILKKPSEHSFEKLWVACEKFFYEAVNEKKSAFEFIEFLKEKPFKLKQGLIDFWVPIFLIANKSNLAVFFKSKSTGQLTYIPEINEEVLDLINKSPKDYFIRKFEIDEKRLRIFNKYREILNQVEKTSFTNESFIETFKPFIIFYKNLSNYAKTTKRLSKEAIKFREAITKSIDPEEVFFTDFPNALGFTLKELEENEKIEAFTLAIKENIRELNAAYDLLVNEIEKFINIEIIGEDIAFPDNRQLLKKRYAKLKKHLLKPELKVFFNRIDTALDDRRSWINSLTQACIGKTLENISDSEINLLKDKLISNFNALDNFTEISEENVDLDKEEVIKLEVTSFLKGLSKKKIRISKSKLKKITNFEKSIKEQLKENDKNFNIALLTRLLQSEIDEES